MALSIRRFNTAEALREETARLLASHLTEEAQAPRAIMLSGGKTPYPIYARVAELLRPESVRTILFPSDERMVPFESPEHNLGNILRTLAPLQIRPEAQIAVNTSLPLEQAAARFDGELTRFFASAGRVPLGLLGLGADGHTASLFSRADVERGAGRYAIPVAREGVDRVSVTRNLLERIDRIVLIVTGEEKAGIIRDLQTDPLRYPAGLALQGAKQAELWTA